jgi:hypothetical protein
VFAELRRAERRDYVIFARQVDLSWHFGIIGLLFCAGLVVVVLAVVLVVVLVVRKKKPPKGPEPG